MTEDRFETFEIRRRVLAAWSASPARFREDANAEEDLVLGAYRDRLVVELAQNAADAAVRAGQPGRLLLALRESEGNAVLVAANTGTVLDRNGVQALATLRASAKRDGDTIGRFGVGFAAVLAISDEPAMLSRSGGIRFSAADTRQLVEEAAQNSAEPTAAELGEELLRRDGHVPALRLPFPAEGTSPDGYDTAVLLPLRDPAAQDLVLRLLDQVDDALLLALPALSEIVIERPDRPTVVLRDVADRWHVLRREGRLSPAVLATRPTEDRGRDRWEVTWALPRESADLAASADLSDWPGPAGLSDPAGYSRRSDLLPQPPVVHAPTPSDEPLPWPALLIATLPLDPSRRHVAPGPVADALVQAAGEAYVELLAERAAAGDAVWPLVVTGLPVGPLDAALRKAVSDRLPDAPILQSAEDPSVLLRPREALALTWPVGADAVTVRVFAAWLAGLVLVPRPATAAFQLLGVRRISLADAVEMLPALADPVRWHEVYAALAPLAGDETVREALSFLPVPLADGKVARGVPGLLLATPEVGGSEVAPALVVLGARVVHPDAVHSLLERLGAVVSGPRALLELPAVRAAVDALTGDRLADPDSPSPEQLLESVLTLVSAAVRTASLKPGDLPWLGELPLRDDQGESTPAAALALPGSVAADWFDSAEIGIVAPELLERWDGDTLAAIGVLRGPGLIRAHDVPINFEPGFDQRSDDGPALELDGWDDWCALVTEELDGMPPGAVLTELIAVRDLDAVRREALPDVVSAIAADPALRPALVTPARIIADGRPFDVPPYTAWWLRDELSSQDQELSLDHGSVGLSATRTGALAGPDADPELRALLRAAPEWATRLDPVARRALGVLTTVVDLDAAAVPGLLARLADDDLEISAELLVGVLARLAVLARQGLEVDRPSRVRAILEDGSEVVDADQAVVIEAPMYRQRADLGAPLPVAPEFASALADLLDLPLAGELAAGEVAEDDDVAGISQPTTAQLRRLLPEVPATWCEHDQLLVDDVEVDWWVNGSGRQASVHAATTDGLARGLAWAAGQWELRGLVTALLSEPDTAADIMIDQVFSNPAPAARPGDGPESETRPAEDRGGAELRIPALTLFRPTRGR